MQQTSQPGNPTYNTNGAVSSGSTLVSAIQAVRKTFASKNTLISTEQRMHTAAGTWQQQQHQPHGQSRDNAGKSEQWCAASVLDTQGG
mmetsp:Transcript_1313/g.3154  ORF Transcript_1313/g.3154 Transcript_1313/m.3154 type:complete len:88 (+) Transcript_1313:297-560(+)